MDFKEQLLEACISHIPTAAEFFGVTEQTIYRWIKYGAPHVALRALELRAGRDQHWHGWRIQRDQIIRPDRRVFTLSELKNWEFELYKARMNL
jgi:transposase